MLMLLKAYVFADRWQLDYLDQAFRQFMMHLLLCLRMIVSTWLKNITTGYTLLSEAVCA